VTAARISSALRKEVRERATRCCEYEPDHIIATKHGGESTIENLALACFDCNRFKGSNIASIDPYSGELTQLFDPRKQEWTEHFSIAGGRIGPRTAVGRVTEIVLKLNLQRRVEVREILASVGRYPSPRK